MTARSHVLRAAALGGAVVLAVSGLVAPAAAAASPAAAPVESKTVAVSAWSSYGKPAEVRVDVIASTDATGVVTISDETEVLASGELSDRSATLELPATLEVGMHELTVHYEGSPDVAPSEGTAKVKITKASTTIKFTTTTAVRGKRAKLTVRASSDLVPTGKVSVTVGGVKLKAVKLSRGKASVRLPKNLQVGDRTVRVRYLGTSNFSSAYAQGTVRVWRAVAKVKGFTTGVQKVPARSVYRDTVKLTRKGVLQRRTGGRWTTVKNVPKGRSTIKIRAGKAGTERKYRVVVKTRGAVKGVKSKTLTLRAR